MIGLASDVDGTLFFNDIPGHIKQNDIQAIKAFQSRGNLFGVCTGRPLSSLGLDDLKIDFYIVSSGALILNQNKELIHEELVDFEIIKTIFNQFNDQFYVYIQGDRQLYCNKEGRLPVTTTHFDDINTLKDGHLYGLSIDALTKENAKKAHQVIKEKFANDIDAYLNIDCIDIVKKGCSKGSGIKIIKEKYQIEHLAGIGDSDNDLPMLKCVDTSFTFNSSHDHIKSQVNYLVDHVSDAIAILNDNQKIVR